MKKLQNYLMKPELMKRKLEKPGFRHDFVEWSKTNLHLSRDSISKHPRSRSPNDHQKSFQSNIKRPQSSSSKENIKYSNNLKATSMTKKRTGSRLEENGAFKSTPTASQFYKKTNNRSLDTRTPLNHKNSTANLNDMMRKNRNHSVSVSKPRIRSAENSVNELFD